MDVVYALQYNHCSVTYNSKKFKHLICPKKQERLNSLRLIYVVIYYAVINMMSPKYFNVFVYDIMLNLLKPNILNMYL